MPPLASTQVERRRKNAVARLFPPRTTSHATRAKSILPMIATVQIAVLLLIVVAAVALAARRLRVPPAILLVIVGIVLALVPGLPRVKLVPELVLLLVLPPLIYSAGIAMSWREFRF